MKLSELASSSSAIDKFQFRDRIGFSRGSELWGNADSLDGIKTRITSFVGRYPDLADDIFRTTELRVGPAEFMMCYLFDNIRLNYNQNTDLLWNGQPTLECKVGRVPKRGEWAGHIVDFTFGSSPASYKLVASMDAYRINHVKYMGYDVPDFKISSLDMPAATLKYMKNFDLTPHGVPAEVGKFSTIQESWAKNVHRDYISGKQFLLFDTKSKSISHAGPLSSDQLSVYRMHHQVYVGVRISN